MTKQIIAVDVDDTLFDENTAVRLFMNETYGFNHTAEDYTVAGPYYGYWENIWKMDAAATAAAYEAFVVSAHKANLQPLPHALTVLRRLKERYELIVVTSRDHRTVAMTHSALAEHYPEVFMHVHFVPLWGDGEQATKAKICNEIGATYLIDDSPHHCELAAEANIQALLFGEYGWNRSVQLAPGMQRVRNWQEVLEYFGV